MNIKWLKHIKLVKRKIKLKWKLKIIQNIHKYYSNIYFGVNYNY